MSLSAIPKIAIIGADGYIGRALLAAARLAHPEALGTSRRRNSPLLRADVRDPALDLTELARTGHACAIITVASPSIMYCEAYPKAAALVNVDGALRAARELHRLGIQPVFLSSDRVFDGAGAGPFDESSARKAASVYGVQKIDVEHGLEYDCPGALIVRLSKIYGLAKGDGTLFDEIASRLLGDKDVDPPFDQIFNPTFVADVVQGILALLAGGASGIVHLCAEPACRRRDLALGMADLLGVDPARVPVPPEATQTTPLRAHRFRELTGLLPMAPLEGLHCMAKAYGAQLESRHQQEIGCDTR